MLQTPPSNLHHAEFSQKPFIPPADSPLSKPVLGFTVIGNRYRTIQVLKIETLSPLSTKRPPLPASDL